MRLREHMRARGHAGTHVAMRVCECVFEHYDCVKHLYIIYKL